MDTKVLKGLLNPLRMKILQTIITNETATTKEISERLGDVPPASLYRHIKKLLEDNIIEICDEKPIRGTIEKVYKIKTNPFKEADAAVSNKDSENLFNIYYTFMMTLLMDFNNYLDGESYDLQDDKVGFRSIPLYLDEEESEEMLSEIRAVIMKRSEYKNIDNRKLRKYSYTFMPTEEKEK